MRRADPWWRLDADVNRIWRFQSFGLSAVVLEDALAGERLLEPVEKLSDRIDLVVEGAGKRLAIECDGDPSQWVDVNKLPEDMERQAILERLGQ